MDAPIVQGDGWEQLKNGVAQHADTANPGQGGNMVLSGHNDVFGEVFKDLDQLKPGDEVMDSTLDATVTLVSCYPYLVDTQRIVVKARLVNS